MGKPIPILGSIGDTPPLIYHISLASPVAMVNTTSWDLSVNNGPVFLIRSSCLTIMDVCLACVWVCNERPLGDAGWGRANLVTV